MHHQPQLVTRKNTTWANIITTIRKLKEAKFHDHIDCKYAKRGWKGVIVAKATPLGKREWNVAASVNSASYVSMRTKKWQGISPSVRTGASKMLDRMNWVNFQIRKDWDPGISGTLPVCKAHKLCNTDQMLLIIIIILFLMFLWLLSSCLCR